MPDHNIAQHAGDAEVALRERNCGTCLRLVDSGRGTYPLCRPTGLTAAAPRPWWMTRFTAGAQTNVRRDEGVGCRVWEPRA